MSTKLPPIHPGEILREEFLVPLGVSAGNLAKAMGVPRTRIERIVAESIGISADTALRLGKALGAALAQSAKFLRHGNCGAGDRQATRAYLTREGGVSGGFRRDFFALCL